MNKVFVFGLWLAFVAGGGCADDVKAPKQEASDAAITGSDAVVIQTCTDDGDCKRGFSCLIPLDATSGTCTQGPPSVGEHATDDVATPTADAGADAAADGATADTAVTSDASQDALVLGSGSCAVVVSYGAGTMKFSVGANCQMPIHGVLAYDPLGHEVEWDQAQQRPAPRKLLGLAADGSVALPQHLAAVVPVTDPDCDPDRNCVWTLNGLTLGTGVLRCAGNDFRHAAFDFLLAVGHDPGRDMCPASQP